MTGTIFGMLAKRIEIDTLCFAALKVEEQKKQQVKKKGAKDEPKVLVSGGLPDGKTTPVNNGSPARSTRGSPKKAIIFDIDQAVDPELIEIDTKAPVGKQDRKKPKSVHYTTL